MRKKRLLLDYALFSLTLFLLSCGNVGVDNRRVSDVMPVINRGFTDYEIPRLDISSYGIKVEVIFSGETVTISALPSGITAELNGAGLLLRSELPGVEYVVGGASSDGSLTIVSRYSPLVTLDSLSLVACGKNAVQISSEEVIFLRAAGDSRITDVAGAEKADNQSAALKLMGRSVLCSGHIDVTAGRRSALFCTGTLFMDGMQLALNAAPNNALLTNGSFVVGDGCLYAQSSKDVVKCKKGDYIMLGGNVTLSSVAEKADGIQAVNFCQKGGNLDIDVSGAASDGIKSAGNLCIDGGNINVITRGAALFNDKKSDYSSASCLKSDIIVEINGGNCNFRSKSDGAKGISCDSLIIVKGGDICVVTEGRDVNDPVDINAHTSSKGIKSDGSLYLAGGNVKVLVFGEGERNEGVEAKGSLYVYDDCNLYVYAYDDAINAANLYFSGGKVYAYSVANDAIDSNGELRVDDGVVIADGSFSPEQGVDVDDYSAFSLGGGLLISLGGSMGPSPAMPLGKDNSVPAFAWSGMSLEKNLFLSLVDSKGVALYSYRVQRVMPDAACLFASSLLDDKGSYAFVISDSVEGGSYVGNGVYAGGHPQGVRSSVSFESEGFANVVGRDGKVTLLESGKGMAGMPPPPGMFPGDSAAMPGGHGFPPPPPGMFPGDSVAMSGGHGFPPPPPPMRRISSEFSESNLPNCDK